MDWIIPLLAIGYLTAPTWTKAIRMWRDLPARAPGPPPRPNTAPSPAAAPAMVALAVVTPAVESARPTPAAPSPPLPIKGGWQYLIGRRIEAVVAMPGSGSRSLAQVYLVLDGDEHFEIYSSTGMIGGTKRLYPGDLPDVLGFGCIGPEAQVYGERRVVPR